MYVLYVIVLFLSNFCYTNFMQPQMPQINMAAKRAFVSSEFARRAGGQMPSSAGIGAETTNTPNPANPIPTEQMTAPPAVSGGAAGTPSDGTVAGMKTQKGEASKLTDAMIFRMKKLTERGE
jgi:hypothetical protein